MQDRKIIGICGGTLGMPGVGKSTVARMLEDVAGFRVASFMTPIKEVARTQMEWDGNLDKKGVIMLNRLCRLGRSISRDYWLNLTIGKLDPKWDKIVMDDLFFEEEEAFIKQCGGKTVQVVRGDIPLQASWIHADFVIENNGDLELLKSNVATVAKVALQ